MAALALFAGWSLAAGAASPELAEAAGWRSALYPEDWTPAFTDAQGRFLHDFSYAGYHAGEKPLPIKGPEPWVDVTQPPYNADNTGNEVATAAIQRAINDVGRQGGGTVFLPAGTYRLRYPFSGANAAILIAHSNVVLQGEGREKTFLFLDETVTRGKFMIKVEPVSGVDLARPGDGQAQPVRSDVKARERVIPLVGPPRFSAGDWVIVQYDATPQWIEEHKMSDGWDASVGGPAFIRRVVSVDMDQHTITVDIPLRYDVKVRDNARVYKASRMLEEVGLADFSVGMRENSKSDGWGSTDWSRPGTGAYDVHGGYAIAINGVVNGWMRNVGTYKPEGNEYAHVHSNAFLFNQSRSLTVRDVSAANPQYAGGGGNGYGVVVQTQESLYHNVRAANFGNAFTFSLQRTSGNVILGGLAANSSGGSASNFHRNLSMANLVDNLAYDHDRFEARDRSHAAGAGGFPKHGVTTTQSVFWNNLGIAYRPDAPYIIRSDQFGWGYVIGTRGPAAAVHAAAASPRTLPGDFVEGVGEGETLIPRSLYLDQLERRLQREGKESVWDVMREELTLAPVGVMPHGGLD